MLSDPPLCVDALPTHNGGSAQRSKNKVREYLSVTVQGDGVHAPSVGLHYLVPQRCYVPESDKYIHIKLGIPHIFTQI